LRRRNSEIDPPLFGGGFLRGLGMGDFPCESAETGLDHFRDGGLSV
jgi:hypothetical protein